MARRLPIQIPSSLVSYSLGLFFRRFWIFLLLQTLQFMIKQTLQHLPHTNRQQDLSYTNSPHNMDKSYIHKHYKICVRLL